MSIPWDKKNLVLSYCAFFSWSFSRKVWWQFGLGANTLLPRKGVKKWLYEQHIKGEEMNSLPLLPIRNFSWPVLTGKKWKDSQILKFKYFTNSEIIFFFFLVCVFSYQFQRFCLFGLIFRFEMKYLVNVEAFAATITIFYYFNFKSGSNRRSG